MKADTTIQVIDTDTYKSSWNNCTTHPLQSWAWGDFRKAMGIDVVRIGVFTGNTLSQGWQVTFHPIPHTPYTIGYFPKGPLPTQDMIKFLQDIGKKKKAISIQVEPDAIQNDTTKKAMSQLLSSYFKSAHHPLFNKYTFVLNLSKSEADLLGNMHPKTRYNIRLAQKHGVTIKNEDSQKAFDAYIRLSQETTKRQGFYAHNKKYHETMWNLLHKADIAHLFTASWEGEILAAWIIFIWKNTVYYPYGASSRSHREIMAPNLLLWEIARWAKQRGCTSFDLWGALGPNPDTHDPWYGFHRFKEGYRPTLSEYIGSYDVIIQPTMYRLYTLADTLRWELLKLRK